MCVLMHVWSSSSLTFFYLLSLCLSSGSTSLLSATFVLEVRSSGVPQCKGRLRWCVGEWGVEEGEQGTRGWELNNG